MVNHLVMYNHTVHNYCSLYYMHEIVEAGPPTQSDDSDDSLPTGLSLPLKKMVVVGRGRGRKGGELRLVK